ncbi:unnamed protein product [Ostreobium quekettii]|uniref:CW-type domain-containing protein n=1 Tax=Ostreobium quekettii TaxID=121088 RepID=A0A8S1IPW4_9CHLO|nr:unnamed protein product [Ostreobium quekettii]
MEPAEDLWVQCDNKGCKKWRRLPVGTVIEDEDAPWFCHMNPDPTRNSCSDSEESYHEEDYGEVDMGHGEATSSPGMKEPKRSSKSQKALKKLGGNKRRKTSEDLARNRRTSSREIGKQGKGQNWQEPRIDRETLTMELKTRVKNMFKIAKNPRTPVSRPDWDIMGIHAPRVTDLACKAADWASAAIYFKKPSTTSGFQERTASAYDNALKFSAIMASLNAVQALNDAGEVPTRAPEDLDDALVIRGERGSAGGA